MVVSTGQSLAHEFGASLLPAILDTMQLLNRSRFVRPTRDNTETAADGDSKGADEGKEMEGAVSRLARSFGRKFKHLWMELDFRRRCQEPDDESARATNRLRSESKSGRLHVTREREPFRGRRRDILGPTVGPTLNGASSDEG